jgi:hypothetical protein
MANGGMSKEQLDALYKAYDELQTNRNWRNREDFDRSLMRSMQDELQHYWKFQTWLRFTHPEVIEEFKAVEDIKERANEFK